jgi:hypothetical protein
MGSPRIVSGFENFIKYAVAHEQKVADAVSGQSDAKPWMNLSESPLQDKATDKTEDALAKVFKRDDANEDYEKARTDPDAKSKQVALAKLAGDFLAACERDKRAQWRSRIRWAAHALGRRWGNGQDAGPLRRNTLDYMSRIFMKAQEVPSSDS